MNISKWEEPILTTSENNLLAIKARSSPENLEELIKRNIRLVLSIAEKWKGCRFLTYEDLVQEGVVGMITAVKRYDESKGAFTTYAYKWITKAISDACEKSEPIVYEHTFYHTRKKCSQLLSQAEMLKIDEGTDEFKTLLLKHNLTETNFKSFKAHSLTTISIPDDYEYEDFEMPSAEEEFIRHEELFALSRALARLSDREHYIVVSFFGIGDKKKSAVELALELGVSRQRIMQILADALAKLKKNKLLRAC